MLTLHNLSSTLLVVLLREKASLLIDGDAPDRAARVVVHCDEHEAADVDLAAVHQQRPLDVLLHDPPRLLAPVTPLGYNQSIFLFEPKLLSKRSCIQRVKKT